MIDAVNEQFSRFVTFAQDKINAGERKAIASKGAVAENGGTTLEERSISVTDKDDCVGKFRRGDDAKKANDEVRELFRKTVADMFGGEKNIPDSVRKAMLMKDYGCGKPLTARRIIAVRDAIARLERVNVFGEMTDPDEELADKAFAAGYTRLDFGRLNTAANLLAKAGGMKLVDAFEQVITKGSAANLAMNAGSPCMKDVNSFRNGYRSFKQIADRDAQNLTRAKELAAEENAETFRQIADNLECKFSHILDNAEKLRSAAKLPRNTLNELRELTNSLARTMKQVSADIASGKLSDGKAIFSPLFDDKQIYDILGFAKTNILNPLSKAAKDDPAIAEFTKYLDSHLTWVRVSYQDLRTTYQNALAKNNAEPMRQKLIDAAQKGGEKTGREISIPPTLLDKDNLEEFLRLYPFEKMGKIDVFCKKLKEHGDSALRFSADQKKALRDLVENAFGKGPKAEKLLQRFVEQFETAFFADELMNPKDAWMDPPTRPDIVLKHFQSNPDAIRLLEIGFKLDTEEDVENAKTALKTRVAKEWDRIFANKNPNADTNLSSGMMLVGVREYNPGYVKFKGLNISNAKLGTKFPALTTFGEGNSPGNFGYAEFLEEKFDANHTRMRQFVSYVCSMAYGISGGIDALIDDGAKNARMKAPPRLPLNETGTTIIAAERDPNDNYNIEISETGDVTITLTHIAKNKVSTLTTVQGDKVEMYAPSNLGQNLKGPMLAGAKFTVTMTIKNATDAELGDKMPEFTITRLEQVEV